MMLWNKGRTLLADMAGWARRSWKQGAVALALLLAILAFWSGPDLWDRFAGRTTGTVFISGPQVYTRERLVNDRYREDAWLLTELDNSPAQQFGITASVIRRQQSNRGMVITFGGTPAETGQGPAAPAPNADAPSIQIPPTPFDQLDGLLAYRERVRNLLIENQLDDRHDLRGNSLYRLRFDAALLPGHNTRNSANVVVSVLPPLGLIDERIMTAPDDKLLTEEEARLASLNNISRLGTPDNKVDVGVWRHIYTLWLNSIERRIDDARKDLQKAYDNNLFTPQDYETLFADMRKDIADSTAGIDAQLAQAGVSYKQTDKQAGQESQPMAKQVGQEVSSPDNGTKKMNNIPPELQAQVDAFKLGNSADQDTEAALNTFRQDFPQLDGEQAASRPEHQWLKLEAKHLVERAITAFELSPKLYQAMQSGSYQPSFINDSTNNGHEPPRSEHWFLNHAFEDRFFRAVLGLGPSHVGSGLGTMAELLPLAQIIPDYGAPVAQPAFRVGEQTLTFTVVTDLAQVPDDVRDQTQRVMTKAGRPVWVLPKQVNAIANALPGYDDGPDLEGVATLAGRQPPPEGYVVVRVEAGLLNFIRQVGRRLDAFSYAFTPSEPDQLVATRTVDDRHKSLAARAAGAMLGGNGDAGMQAEQGASDDAAGLATRKLVVGYGQQHTSAIPRFGWLLQPQVRSPDGGYVQQAWQTSLTALISLPAWWEEIRVRVEHSWTDDRGRTGAATEPPQLFTIELPVSFDAVDASVFELTDASPSIRDWGTTGMRLRACDAADIPIPGRRLWRSTVVTLGGQKADEIFVMPDMNGIIASFKQVQIPATWKDTGKPFPADVTVWTSHGSAKIPYPAMLFMPKGMPADDSPKCPPLPDKTRSGDAPAKARPGDAVVTSSR